MADKIARDVLERVRTCSRWWSGYASRAFRSPARSTTWRSRWSTRARAARSAGCRWASCGARDSRVAAEQERRAGGSALPRAWIGMGSNIGDRLDFIRRALEMMTALPGTELVTVSSVYDTAARRCHGSASFPERRGSRSRRRSGPEELLRANSSTIENGVRRVRHERVGTADARPRHAPIRRCRDDDRGAHASAPAREARGRSCWCRSRSSLPTLVIPGRTESVSELVAALGDVRRRRPAGGRTHRRSA